jgi:hypothetical protein
LEFRVVIILLFITLLRSQILLYRNLAFFIHPPLVKTGNCRERYYAALSWERGVAASKSSVNTLLRFLAILRIAPLSGVPEVGTSAVAIQLDALDAEITIG